MQQKNKNIKLKFITLKTILLTITFENLTFNIYFFCLKY